MHLWKWTRDHLATFDHPKKSPVHQIAFRSSPPTAVEPFAVSYDNGDICVGEITKKKDEQQAKLGAPRELKEWRKPRPIAFAPDGQVLAAGHGGIVTLWLLRPWRWRVGLETNRHVLALAYAPDGRHLAAVGVGGQVILWDATSAGKDEIRKTAAHRFDGHDGDVTCVAWTPDGKTLITGGADGTMRRWAVPEKFWPTTKGGR